MLLVVIVSILFVKAVLDMAYLSGPARIVYVSAAVLALTTLLVNARAAVKPVYTNFSANVQIQNIGTESINNSITIKLDSTINGISNIKIPVTCISVSTGSLDSANFSCQVVTRPKVSVFWRVLLFPTLSSFLGTSYCEPKLVIPKGAKISFTYVPQTPSSIIFE